tara:strand:+ start:6448 stop:7716 length:1269 start_codon:yes stop_codon:yes gene_type:complete
MFCGFVKSRTDQTKLPRVVWAAAWVSFFADFSTELYYGVLPAFYLQTLSLSIVTLGIIEGVAESIVAITKLWSGTLSDRTGHRPVWMVAGYGISALAKPLMAFASGGVLSGLLRGMDRFGKGIRGAPRDALLSESIDDRRRGRAFGVVRAMDHAGALVGGVAAAGLLALGLVVPRDLFLLSVIPGVAAVGVIILFVREPKAPNKPVQIKHKPFSLLSAWHDATPQLKSYLYPASLFALGNASDMLLLAIAYERFIESGYSQPVALGILPLLWALLHVIKSVGSSWAGSNSDRFGHLPMLRLGWVVYSAVYALAAWLAFGGPAWLAWGMFALYGFYTVLTEAPEKALISAMTPDGYKRGSAYGLIHFVAGIGTLPATLIASAVWFRFGAGYAFGIDAAIAGLAVLFLGRVRSSTEVLGDQEVF